MIKLSDYCSFDFAVASGALGFDGRGYWWERPLRWLGFIDPSQFIVITKTLTLHPRKGNLRWWCPWRCVRLIPGGTVNAVGLTNPGLREWFNKYYRNILIAPWKTILSIAPENVDQAAEMGWLIKAADSGISVIEGVEVNASCPNVGHHNSVSSVVKIVQAVAMTCNRPVLVKLGWQDPYLDICKKLDNGTVAAFDLINTVPWSQTLQGQCTDSPLKKYGLSGGVSGHPIAKKSIEVLKAVKAAGIRTPVLSGGGVCTIEDVRERFITGADAVSFGTLFLIAPWQPNKIVKQWRQEHAFKHSGLE